MLITVMEHIQLWKGFIRLIVWNSLFTRNVATKGHQIDSANMVNRAGKRWVLAIQ